MRWSWKSHPTGSDGRWSQPTIPFMRLTILGSNGTYATPGRPSSGYLVEHEGTIVWLEAGFGTFAALQEVTDVGRIDAVVVSHAHPDHCVDLLAFYHAARFGTAPRAGIPVHLPAGLPERLKAFLGDPNHPIAETLDFQVRADGDGSTVGEIRFGFAGTDHPVPTLAVRAEADGRVLAYSADTGPLGDWPRLTAGADLFLCEATYQGSAQAKPFAHHLTAGEAGEIARRSEVRSLMLTHLWPGLDPGRSVEEAEAGFGRAVRLAVPGMVVEV